MSETETPKRRRKDVFIIVGTLLAMVAASALYVFYSPPSHHTPPIENTVGNGITASTTIDGLETILVNGNPALIEHPLSGL